MKITLPRNWERRIVTRFLWFPVAIGNDWRWLEVASYEEEYFKSNDSPIGFWEKIKWCTPNNACTRPASAVGMDSESDKSAGG